MMNLCGACFVKIGSHKKQHMMVKDFVLDPAEVLIAYSFPTDSKKEYHFQGGDSLGKTLENAFAQFSSRPCLGEIDERDGGYRWQTFKEVGCQFFGFNIADLGPNR
jgi:hypothetical protein